MDPAAMDTNPLLTTKLYPPPITSDMVPRTQLLDHLRQYMVRPLTLISAPAGYGKSVLASMWLQNTDRPFAWVSLDEHDNDLPTFLAYLLAAVKTAVPDDSFQQTQALIEMPNLPPVPVVANYFLNDLARVRSPFCLALDDIHVISNHAIFELLTVLLKYPSPTLHLVLIGRHDPPLPIASLRAYGKITETRVRDLRFDSLETAQLLKKVSRREISESVAAEWTEKTEGWVVALQLMAISLPSRRKTLMPNLSTKSKNRYLQEYLLTEVLEPLPPARKACLLKTALMDSFCAQLCEVVCFREGESNNPEDLTGEDYIQWLQESNFFLIPLDDENKWFRFHHLIQSYFRNILELQFSHQDMAALHLKASSWLADNGRVEEAIEHAFKAGDTTAAASYVYRLRDTFMNNEQWMKLERILRLFPEELVNNDPVLSITMAQLALIRGPAKMIPRYLEAAEHLVASLPLDSPLRKVVSGEVATLTSIQAIITGQTAAQIAADAEHALEMLPKHSIHTRGLAIGAQVAGYQMAGNWQRGFLAGREIVADPHSPPEMQAAVLLYLCTASFMEGALDVIYLAASQSLQLGRKRQLWPESGRRQYFLGIAYYLRNHSENAEMHLLKTVNDRFTHPSYFTFGTCALARLYLSQSRHAEADQILQLASAHLDDIGDLVSLETIRAFQVEIALDRNNLDEAQRICQTVNFDLRPMVWFHYIPQLTPIKLLLHQGGQKNLEEAQIQLAAIEEHLRAINRKTILIDVLALQALAHYAMGNELTAHEKLRESLRLAEPGGFIRNYVDLGPKMVDLLRSYQHTEMETTESLSYAAKILGAFPQATSDSPVSDEAIAPPQLTRRETEILQLMATDLSPEEIADEKFISVATARTHIRNIYAKLGVHGRFEAVELAKKLEIL